LESSIAWTVWYNSRKGERDLETKAESTLVWSLSTVGAVGGGLLGSALGTTPGRSSWVGSTALWTGLIFGFATGALVKPDNPPPASPRRGRSPRRCRTIASAPKSHRRRRKRSGHRC